MQNQAIFLMGPTAVGKTALAMQLADLLPLELISVDSAMVYRGLDIGTGKPSPRELQSYPHALIDICDPKHIYSAAQFCNDAQLAMQQAWSRGRIPLLVGGTMLYFKALQFGLSILPTADPQLRTQLSVEALQIGWPAMHAKLAIMDQSAAAQLNPNDAQRIQRALEINILTGRTLLDNFKVQRSQPLDYMIHSYALLPDARSALHEKIAQRFDQMLQDGLIEEVRQLFLRGDLGLHLPAIRAVGYRQVWSYLANEYDYETMRDRAIAATRQLAKRQHTWLRSWQDVQILDNTKINVSDLACQIRLSLAI